MTIAIHDIDELAGKFEISINVMTAGAFYSFTVRLMQYGVQANAIVHGLSIAEAIPAASHATIAQVMLMCAKEVVAQRLDVLERDYRFVNLVCDAGTVTNVKVATCARKFDAFSRNFAV
jgi:hypothetical protein